MTKVYIGLMKRLKDNEYQCLVIIFISIESKR